MKKTEEKSSRSAEGLYKFFIYFVLILLAVTIIVPVAWVFMASIKQNSEFYGNPWALPAGFYWQNFVNAWNGAKMGEYMLNSVLVTALALVLLLVIALPAAYCLSRFRFKGRKLLNTLFMAGLLAIHVFSISAYSSACWTRTSLISDTGTLKILPTWFLMSASLSIHSASWCSWADILFCYSSLL